MSNEVILDGRMSQSSGIGVYIRNLQMCLHTSIKYYEFIAPIYSIKEQLLYLKLPYCTLFWSPHYNVPFFPIKAKYRLVTIHDVYHLAFYETLSFKQKLYAKVMIIAAVRLSDHIITVSKFSKAEIMKHTGCSSEKITVIHNGTRQMALKVDVENVRQRYHLPDKFFLFVGNVKPHKNLKILIQAFQVLPGAITCDHSIVIVGKKDGFITGDPELLDEIESNPKLSGKVRFTGFVDDDDLDTIYSLASLFVFPSYYEGFGLPPLEAMLNNCPVISSDAASMPEVCGDAALYFNPHNAEELAEKIALVLGDAVLRAKLVAAGKERIKEFTWGKSAAQHMAVINSILSSK